jgi:hypothetical protein
MRKSSLKFLWESVVEVSPFLSEVGSFKFRYFVRRQETSREAEVGVREGSRRSAATASAKNDSAQINFKLYEENRFDIPAPATLVLFGV